MKNQLLQTLFLFFILLSQATLYGQWRTIEAPYGIIQSFGAASSDKLFLPGGLAGGGVYVSTVAVYDITSNTWSEMPLSVPRSMIAATINGNLLFCAGGIQFENGAEEYAAIEIYNTDTNEPLGLAELSQPRVALSAVSVGSKVLFAGGANPSIDPNTFGLTGFEVFSRVDIYDTATNTWSTAELSDPRAGMAHAVLGDKAYFAGGDKGNGVVSDVVDIYDATTDTWTTETLSVARSFYGGGGSFKGKVYFAGGTTADSQTSTQIDIYEPATNTWNSEQLSTPRGGVQIGTTENHILFAAGASEGNLVQWQSEASSNIVDIYNAETDEWDIYEMAVERMNHTVLSAQDQVYVIGGYDLSTFQVHSSIDVFRGKQLDYDGAVTDKSPNNTYTIATLNHLNEQFTVNYQIENTGKFSLNSVIFMIEVKRNGEVVETENLSVDLPNTGDIKEVSYSYLPEEEGLYEIVVTTTQPNIGVTFFEDSKVFEISATTLAKDDGVIDNFFAWSNLSPDHFGYFGSEFELLSPDQLSAVSIVVVSDPEATFNLVIKAVDNNGNIQEEDIYKSDPILASDAITEDFSYYTFHLPDPIQLDAGKYVFAFGQDELGKSFGIGMDQDNSDSGFWDYNGLEMSGWVNSTQPLSLMIRPHFGESSATNPLAAEQWNKIANTVLPIGHEVTSIQMVDDTTIWMTTFGFFGPENIEASILKSIDGGLTWEVISTPELANHYPTDISPIDGNIAYVSMLDGGPDTQDGVIADALFKTIDGGKTWDKVDAYPYSPVYLHFFNENEGWIMGEAEDFVDGVDIIMSTTTDGGQTWSHAGGTEWNTAEGQNFPNRDSIEEVGFLFDSFTGAYDVAENSIMVGSLNRIWISSDKGKNWKTLASPLFTNDSLYTTIVAMKDEQTFIVASNLEAFDLIYRSPKAYATTDGGQTWIESNPSVYPADIDYLPGTEHSFIITGHNQFTEFSGIHGTDRTDDLANWEYVDDKRILSMAFAEEKGIGLFANYPNLSTTGNIYSWGEETIPAYDALVARTNQYEYTEVTLNHLEQSFDVSYDIQSIGQNDLTNMVFYFEVIRDGVLIFSDSTTIALVDTSGVGQVSFSYLPDELGFYEFKLFGSQANLGNNFYQDIQTLNVNETTLNKDDGNPNSGISPNFISPEHYGYLGTEFNLLNDDQFSAITLFIVPDSTSEFHIIVKAVDENGNTKEGEVFKSAPILGSEVPSSNIYTYVLEEPLDLVAGSYIFAVGQDRLDGLVVYGFDTDRTDDAFWVYSPVDTTAWEKFTNGTLMFRPHFGNFMITNTEEELLAQITPLKVFPVPFQESVYIQLDYPVESTARLQLFDATGRQWVDRVVDHRQLIRQDVRQVPDGIYFLRISSGKYIRTVKVLKQ